MWEFIKLALAFIPGIIWKAFCPGIWIITETPDTARDNGYWLFKYIRENKKDRRAYYAIKKDAYDRPRVEKLGNVIRFSGARHYMLMWAAERYIGTTKAHGFPEEDTGAFLAGRGLCGWKYVFLNHGVARGSARIVMEHLTYYSLIMAMSEQEKRIICEINGQPEEKVKAIGFCRQDNLNDDLLENDLILFMPTWRKWLDVRHESDPQVIEDRKKDFLSSLYYKSCSELINDTRMTEFLEKNDLRMVVYLHSYAQGFLPYFSSGSDRITIAKQEDFGVQELLKRAAYLITDYSSVIYDFAYMKKPCCYYQFDAEEFSKNQYAESDLYSYEKDGFGPVLHTFEEVMSELDRSHGNAFKMDKKYEERVENYFPGFENDHCEKTYALIEQL